MPGSSAKFKGQPHFIAGHNDCKCFFAVAKPYPSRNTAMLNTFLELKMENERLRQHLSELRKRAPQHLSSTTMLSSYGPSMQTPLSYPVPTTIPNRSSGEMAQPYYPMYGTSAAMPTPITGTMDGSSTTPYTAMYGSNLVVDDDVSEDGSRKKKPKKSYANEQHVCVTCGRTDSPEWRKGPQGPKTLCNACGLRWAKLQRKTDDTNDVVGGNDSRSQASTSTSNVAT